MRNNSTKKMVFAAVGIAINIILGIFVGGLKIPLLFMDTVGTVFTAVVLGPFWGACTCGVNLLGWRGLRPTCHNFCQKS